MVERHNPFVSIFIKKKTFFGSQIDSNGKKVLEDEGDVRVLARASTYFDVAFKPEVNGDIFLVAKATRKLMDLQKTDECISAGKKYEFYLDEAFKILKGGI